MLRFLAGPITGATVLAQATSSKRTEYYRNYKRAYRQQEQSTSTSIVWICVKVSFGYHIVL